MSLDKKRWLGRLGRSLRLHSLRSLRENASPMRTALGIGLGAFVGIVPSFLIGLPIAYFMAGRLGLNRAATIAGAVVSMNPLTAPVLYTVSAWLGMELTGRHVADLEFEGILSYLREMGVPFLIGSTVVAVVVAGIFGLTIYFVVRRTGPRGIRNLLTRPRRFQPAPPQTSAADSAEFRALQ